MPDVATPAVLLASAGIAGGILLAAGLLVDGRSPTRTANLLLALAVLAVALLSVGDVLDRTGLILRWPHFLFAFDWLLFAIGPLLLLYVRAATGTIPPGRRWRTMLHFVPACLALLASLPVYWLPTDAKRAAIREDIAERATGLDPILLIAAVHVLVYLALALRAHRAFRRRLRLTHATLGALEKRWLQLTLAVALASWLAWAVSLLVHSAWAQGLNLLAAPLSLYLLAFIAILRRGEPAPPRAAVTEALSPPAQEVDPHDAQPGRYQRSGLSPERAQICRTQLETLMATDKPWLENDLTLVSLAERAGLTTHHLSQLLNECIGETFFDFVNRHRVQEVQRCLADPAYDGQTILAIAFASGFNSKTAFNSAFRRYTHSTPSAWRRRIAQARPSAQS